MFLFGLCGKAGTGKNATAEFLQEYFLKKYLLELHQVSFAEHLKLICKSHFGLTDEQLNGDKKEIIDLRFQKTGEGSNVPAYWTPREIMQRLGGFYRSIDENFWITQLQRTISVNKYDNVNITDVRYENECEYVKNSPDGFLIKIVRPELMTIHGMDHASEISLDKLPDDYFDLIVNNNGNLEDLVSSVPDIVEAIMVVNKLKSKGRVYNAKK